VSILIDAATRVVVQGITGNQGSFHTGQMLQYGTKVVAGVSPAKAGTKDPHGVPVFAGVAEAVAATGADASILFVPAPFARDAAFEALAAGVRLLVMIPEHIPVQDTIAILEYARYKGATVVGPNTFGVISPGKSKMGIMPNHIYRPGSVAVVARSGTLSYEIANELTEAGFGQSTVVGMGGDPVAGLTFIEVLEALKGDPETEAVVLVGEIGGRAEEDAARYIKEAFGKPVVAYLAGRAAPPGKRMGHAGAIIERGVGTLESKRKALTEAGVTVVDMPWEVADALRAKVAAR
jgi:succinyl-CoA synthetase alpha subunit